MGCGASAGVARVEQPAHKKDPDQEVCKALANALAARGRSAAGGWWGARQARPPSSTHAVVHFSDCAEVPAAQADSEKLEMKVKMARVGEWASSLGPAPWEDITEAALRLGMKTGPRPKGDRRASYSSKDSHPAKPRSQSRERELRQREKELLESPAIDSPLSPDGDNSTHISGNEIRDAAGKSSRRPHDTAPEAISVGRPALSTEGWDKGEPSVGASEEMDKLAGLGKVKLSSGGLRNALKSLHESIMGKSSLQHAFYEFDKNKDNRISLEEFLEACSDMTTTLPESQLSEVVSVYVQERIMLLPSMVYI